MLLFALLLPTLIFYLILSDHSLGRDRTNLFLLAPLSFGLGIGITSLSLFAFMCAIPECAKSYAFFETLCLAPILIWLAILSCRRRTGEPAAEANALPNTEKSSDSLLVYALAIVCVLMLVAMVFMALSKPHGEWDAWKIWNYRARFIYRGGVSWRNGFSPLIALSHPDYPLLLPGTVARLWHYCGESLFATSSLSILFAASTLSLLGGALYRLRSANVALIAALALAGTEFFIKTGAAQYADIPLAFYILATFVLLAIYEQDKTSAPKWRLLFLAGLAAGFAAWTKNEGTLFIVALALAAIITHFKTNGKGSGYLKIAACFLGGFIITVVALIYFKLYIAPANDLIEATSAKTLIANFTDPSRYKSIVMSGGKYFFKFTNVILPLLIAYGIVFGIRLNNNQSSQTVIIGTASILFVLGGYLLVYLNSPHDVDWHIGASLRRLLMHVWPSCIFCFFLATNSPDDKA